MKIQYFNGGGDVEDISSIDPVVYADSAGPSEIADGGRSSIEDSTPVLNLDDYSDHNIDPILALLSGRLGLEGDTEQSVDPNLLAQVLGGGLQIPDMKQSSEGLSLDGVRAPGLHPTEGENSAFKSFTPDNITSKMEKNGDIWSFNSPEQSSPGERQLANAWAKIQNNPMGAGMGVLGLIASYLSAQNANNQKPSMDNYKAVSGPILAGQQNWIDRKQPRYPGLAGLPSFAKQSARAPGPNTRG